MLRWLIGIILGEIICESLNWQHIQRWKITIVGANWQLFRLKRIAKCPYFILSTLNVKFYWFVMKIKKILLPIWWYNRGLFPLGNKCFGVFFLNGLKFTHCFIWIWICYFMFRFIYVVTPSISNPLFHQNSIHCSFNLCILFDDIIVCLTLYYWYL